MSVTFNASTTSGIGITSDNSGAIQFQSNAANTVIIDTSGNVGIGTSSPSQVLDVNGNIAITGTARRIVGEFRPAVSAANRTLFLSTGGTADTNVGVIPNAATGSAYFTVYNATDASNSAYLTISARSTTDARIDSNINGTGSYLPMTFYTGGSERMRIDSSGNVGIGTSSPSSFGKFAVTGSSGTVFVGSSGQNIVFTAAGTNYITTQTAGGQIQFQTGAGSDAMLINSSGNVGIGTTSPGSGTKLNVSGRGLFTGGSFDPSDGTASGVSISYDTTNSVGIISSVQTGVSLRDLRLSGSSIFFNAANNTERLRIDSSGYVFINETATVGTASWLTITAAASSVYGATIKDSGTTYATTTRYMNFVNSTNAVAGSIQHTAATTTAFSTSSDARLKKNIVDAPSAIDIVANIPVRSYDWKEDNSHVKFGFVAQELGQVYEEPVGVGGDDVNSDPWSIEYGRMTPILVKALQELKSEFDAYKATHP